MYLTKSSLFSIKLKTKKLNIFKIFFHSLKDKLKKVVLEKEQLESQLKTEKDEKELYKVTCVNRDIGLIISINIIDRNEVA